MSEKNLAVDRALDILLLLYDEEQEIGISDIARQLKLPKSATHRILTTLEDKGFVYKNLLTDKYWLGMKLYAIGSLAGEKSSFLEVLKPFAKSLFDEFSEAINVSVLEKTPQGAYQSVMIFKESDENKVLLVNPKVGSTTDAHASSVGKCLLAFTEGLDKKTQQWPLVRHTANTITTWPELLAELQTIREQGYAIDNEEQEIGLYCIGAPLLNRKGKALAAISISGPEARMRQDGIEPKIKRLLEVSRALQKLL